MLYVTVGDRSCGTVVEDDIEHSMQLVFDAPMGANRRGEGLASSRVEER